ncbi:MAG: hypothetical protein J7K94_04620, partial [Dehalococcoidia bacterium]|nr:hypothetical protein [Dehalococcoidia bacterium]
MEFHLVHARIHLFDYTRKALPCIPRCPGGGAGDGRALEPAHATSPLEFPALLPAGFIKVRGADGLFRCRDADEGVSWDEAPLDGDQQVSAGLIDSSGELAFPVGSAQEGAVDADHGLEVRVLSGEFARFPERCDVLFGHRTAQGSGRTLRSG